MVFKINKNGSAVLVTGSIIVALVLAVFVFFVFSGWEKDVNSGNESGNLSNISGLSNFSSGAGSNALKEKNPEMCEDLQPEIKMIQCKIRVYAELKDKSYCESLKNSNLSVTMQFGNRSIISNVADFCKYKYSSYNREEYCDVSNELKEYCLEVAKR